MSNLSKTDYKIALSQINVIFKLKYCLVKFVGFFLHILSYYFFIFLVIFRFRLDYFQTPLWCRYVDSKQLMISSDLLSVSQADF